jgi:hypothetical protein
MTADGQCWELQMPARRTAERDSGCLLPTPTAANYGSCQGGSAGREGQKNRPSLHSMARHAMWPTPTVKGNHNRKGLTAKSGDGLATAVKKWPTPTARDWRSGKASQATLDRNSRPLNEAVQQSDGGALNPTWVEWLMGWPLGWTDCAPLETDRFQQWRQSHSVNSFQPSTEETTA